MSAIITMTGRLTANPEIRFTQNGDSVVSFSLAHTDRKFDRSTNQWVDAGETLFMNVSAFKQLADGSGDALVKGDTVTVVGKLKQRSYDAKDGTRRTTYEIVADEIGRSVRARKNGSNVAAAPVQEPAW